MKVKTLLVWISSILVLIIGILGFSYYTKISPWKAVSQDLFSPDRTKQPGFLFSLGNNSEDAESLVTGPLGVDADDRGQIYVANTQKNTINIYDANGKLSKTFGRTGTGKGEFTYPSSITVAESQIFVSEPLSGRIQVFDREGRFLRNLLDEKSLKTLSGIKPVGIGVSEDRLYISDALHHRIVMTNFEGEIIKTFGQVGSKEGEFSYPYDVAVDKQGRVFVSDTNNSRVQVFDAEGEFLQIIKGADEASSFSLPRGIAFDQYNRLMVVDTFLHQVLFFEPDGTFLFALGSRGTGDGQLNFPNGIGTGGGRVFVTDRENNRVLVFEP